MKFETRLIYLYSYVSHCRLKYGRLFRLCWGRRNESAIVDSALHSFFADRLQYDDSGCYQRRWEQTSPAILRKTRLDVWNSAKDSAVCGGPPNESIQFGSNAINVAKRPEETERQTGMRLNQEWHACMTEKVPGHACGALVELTVNTASNEEQEYFLWADELGYIH